MTTSKINPDYNAITFNDVLMAYDKSNEQLDKEYLKILKVSADKNTRCFAGNNIIYHYQHHELLNTRRGVTNYKLMEEIFADEQEKKYWIDLTISINRRKKNEFITAKDIYEGYRRCKGAVVFFKTPTAKFLYKKFGATKILDPTAGWGGRMLGAMSLGLEYTGIDTNINLKKGYDAILSKWGTGKEKMIYEDVLKVDFEKLDYDFVLTSPPYFNLEQYSHMELFDNEKAYYEEFLIPLIKKCLKYIKNNGKVLINISDYMYDLYIKYGGNSCDETIELLQQKVPDGKGKSRKNKEQIYIFSNK